MQLPVFQSPGHTAGQTCDPSPFAALHAGHGLRFQRPLGRQARTQKPRAVPKAQRRSTRGRGPAPAVPADAVATAAQRRKTTRPRGTHSWATTRAQEAHRGSRARGSGGPRELQWQATVAVGESRMQALGGPPLPSPGNPEVGGEPRVPPSGSILKLPEQVAGARKASARWRPPRHFRTSKSGSARGPPAAATGAGSTKPPTSTTPRDHTR